MSLGDGEGEGKDLRQKEQSLRTQVPGVQSVAEALSLAQELGHPRVRA